MDDVRFGRVLVGLIVAVGLLGLFGAGSLEGITGAVTKVKTFSSSLNQDIEGAKARCNVAKTAYDDGCTQVVTDAGVLRPVGTNCQRLKNDMNRMCGTYERMRKAVTAEKQLRGTNPGGEWLTGGVVADVDTGAASGIPWSLVLVAGLVGLVFYSRRRQTR